MELQAQKVFMDPARAHEPMVRIHGPQQSPGRRLSSGKEVLTVRKVRFFTDPGFGLPTRCGRKSAFCIRSSSYR